MIFKKEFPTAKRNQRTKEIFLSQLHKLSKDFLKMTQDSKYDKKTIDFLNSKIEEIETKISEFEEKEINSTNLKEILQFKRNMDKIKSNVQSNALTWDFSSKI
ncbi:hypothetical protein DID78_01030 [Candidatus Marinamargulisbacteria bacterium SCGC AG-343-D04]|nr:hypothetical protein DID78_01030 [Candidatus Marinamargulisbacteria bacterium SCGC AG-343-D04]